MGGLHKIEVGIYKEIFLVSVTHLEGGVFGLVWRIILCGKRRSTVVARVFCCAAVKKLMTKLTR